MYNLRAVTVCVDYWDYLQLCLPRNRHHFQEYWIVTSPQDTATQLLAEHFDCKLYVTDAFYRHGAKFNKWAALEEGYDRMGKHGWLCSLDADIIWPEVADLGTLQEGVLYCPLRHMYEPIVWDYTKTKEDKRVWIPPENEWPKYQIHHNVGEWAGYSQIFNASDYHLLTPPPHIYENHYHASGRWLGQDWTHAGGADTDFQNRWPRECKVRPPFKVLHLGECAANWYGRATPLLNGDKLPGSEERLRECKGLWQVRRQSGNADAERIRLS